MIKKKVSSPVKKSPALQRWRNAVKAVTPDILRQARALRKQANERTKPSVQPQQPSNDVLASSNFSTVAAETTASHIRTEEARAERAERQKQLTKSFNLHVTRPMPFRFATDSRGVKSKRPAAEPVRAAAEEAVDFAKMLRNYEEKGGTRPPPVIASTLGQRESRRRSR